MEIWRINFNFVNTKQLYAIFFKINAGNYYPVLYRHNEIWIISEGKPDIKGFRIEKQLYFNKFELEEIIFKDKFIELKYKRWKGMTLKLYKEPTSEIFEFLEKL